MEARVDSGPDTRRALARGSDIAAGVSPTSYQQVHVTAITSHEPVYVSQADRESTDRLTWDARRGRR